MTIRLSTLSAGNARASRTSETETGVVRTPIPPPLPPPDSIRSEDDLSDGVAEEDTKPPAVLSSGSASADASTAPTLRPPPSAVHTTNVAQATLRMGTPPLGSPPPGTPSLTSPAPTVPRPAGIPLEERGRREYRGLGFTSVVRHLSLRGWLRWIQSNECDATLRVRTRDGGSGCIWCSSGKVVDAEWNAMTGASARAATFSGEPGLVELLRLESGSVSIDFDPVDRPRRIARMTLPLEEELGPPAAVPPEPPAAVLPEPPPAAVPRALRLSRTEYFSGGILLGAFVLLAFAFGRQRAAGDDAQGMVVEGRREQETQALLPPPSLQKSAPRAQSASPEPADLSLIRFATLEVEPARAEIWLDHSLLGLGHVELAPLIDGELHELRFVAEGRAPRSLYFVGSPPSGRVVLEQAEPAVSTAASRGDTAGPVVSDPAVPAPAAPRGSEAEQSPASPRAEPSPRVAVRAAPRRRSAAVASAAAANPPSLPAAPARSEAASSAKAMPNKKSPQIQLIEVHTPRVQVLD